MKKTGRSMSRSKFHCDTRRPAALPISGALLITTEGDDCRMTGREKSFEVSSVRLSSSGTSSMARLQSIKLTIRVRSKFPRIQGAPRRPVTYTLIGLMIQWVKSLRHRAFQDEKCNKCREVSSTCGRNSRASPQVPSLHLNTERVSARPLEYELLGVTSNTMTRESRCTRARRDYN